MSRWGSFFRLVGAAVISYFSGNWSFFAAQVARERQSVIQARRNRRARQEFNDAQIDRLEMIERDPRMPRTRCYGRVRNVEGVHRPWSSGTFDEKLTLPVSFAGHEIDGFEQWYLFDLPVTLDGSGWVQEAPYMRTVAAVENQTRSGDGTITLPADYVTGSAVATWFLVEGDNSTTGTASVSVVGTTATVSGAPVGSTVGVAYQRGVVSRYVRIRPYLGTDAQNIGAALAAEYPGKITSTDKAAGVAMAIMDCIFEPDVFPQGRPTLTAVFRGAKLYDPRKDSTVAGGSGSHRVDNPATWEWSRNPALIAYDWARYRWGMNVPAAEINTADVIAAANACDVSTVFTLRKSPTVTETATLPRFQCDMVVPTGSNPEEVMDRIVATMGGRWCWAGGLLRLRAGVLNSTVATIDKTWLMEAVDDNGQPDGEAIIQAAQGYTRDERYNRVTGSCIDPDKRYQLLAYPAVEDAVLIAAKGEREAEIDFEGVAHIAHAQHLASMVIRQAQAGQKVEMRVGLKGLGLELLDVFSLTYNDRHGITGKTYEVVGWKFSPEEGVRVVGEEISAALFTVDAELTGRDPAPDSDLRPPWDVEQLTGLSVTSGTAAVLDSSILTRTVVSWTAAAGISVRQGGKVEVQYCPADAVPAAGLDWPSWPEEGSATQAVIPGLLAGRYYLFRARFVQPLPLVRGAWCTGLARHLVAVPPQVGTGGIAPGAATQVAHTTTAGPVTDSGAGLTYDICTLTFTPGADGTLSCFASYDAVTTAVGDWFDSYGCYIRVVQGASTIDSPVRGLKSTRLTQQVEHTVSVVAGTSVTVTLRGVAAPGVTTNWWNARLQYELIKR